ncbi:hypothetical protein [Streptomyces sp. NBC_01216]|uniref:hypothetical protein n=1 Tax=unclassified Streptomyces TaxID=2593676 RepID=UPI002E0D2AB6|nr:hypothetical protein OG393_05635 [Streptomyces sp. NBC_01216]
MNRLTLARVLREAGVPGDHYRIEDAHEPVPPPPDFVYLRREPGGAGWETGVYERGTHHAVATHATEAEACAHLRTLL